MKKTLIALAAVAATSAAFAQSSVTLFGVVDLNIRNVKQGGDSLTSMSQDGIASSRLGFRGVEDLGGGMKAGFHLEAPINPDTGGTAGLNFVRQSTLSLMGGFGEVRLGRDYTPTFWIHNRFDPFGTNGVGNSVNTFVAATGGVLGSGATTTTRASNTLGYFTPTIGGFQAQFMYAFKETSAANDPNEYTGISVTYAAGPLRAALATASEGSAATNTNSLKRTNFGLAYDLGFMRPMVQYTQATFQPNIGAEREVKHFLVGATAKVGPGMLKASYVRSDYDNFAGDADQFAVGYQYDLSKRTALYGNYSRISNDGAATFGFSPSAAGVTAGGNATGFEFGVRHTF